MFTFVPGTRRLRRNKKAKQTPRSVRRFLKSYCEARSIELALAVVDFREVLPSVLQESFVNSPRRNHVQEVGSQILQVATSECFLPPGFAGSYLISFLHSRSAPK